MILPCEITSSIRLWSADWGGAVFGHAIAAGLSAQHSDGVIHQIGRWQRPVEGVLEFLAEDFKSTSRLIVCGQRQVAKSDLKVLRRIALVTKIDMRVLPGPFICLAFAGMGGWSVRFEAWLASARVSSD